MKFVFGIHYFVRGRALFIRVTTRLHDRAYNAESHIIIIIIIQELYFANMEVDYRINCNICMHTVTVARVRPTISGLIKRAI